MIGGTRTAYNRRWQNQRGVDHIDLRMDFTRIDHLRRAQLFFAFVQCRRVMAIVFGSKLLGGKKKN